VWPPAVEDVAAVFRAAGTEARLEELPPGEDAFPGQGVRADAFNCDGRRVVVLVPAEREADPGKFGCRNARVMPSPRFPYSAASVLLDSSLLVEPIVWIEAGSPRHVLGVSPAELARLVRAQTGDLVVDA
jgi:hypothetical protein